MTTNNTLVKIIFDRWNASVKNCDDLLNELSNETLQKEIAPGKNRGIYLLGHLIAVHDDMLRLLDMGEKQYPELFKPFIELADKSTEELPSVTELRNEWAKQCEYMKQRFDQLQPSQWLEK